jgi:ribonucleotide monophosphatase NagD (HAD superfamily)
MQMGATLVLIEAICYDFEGCLIRKNTRISDGQKPLNRCTANCINFPAVTNQL